MRYLQPTDERRADKCSLFTNGRLLCLPFYWAAKSRPLRRTLQISSSFLPSVKPILWCPLILRSFYGIVPCLESDSSLAGVASPTPTVKYIRPFGFSIPEALAKRLSSARLQPRAIDEAYKICRNYHRPAVSETSTWRHACAPTLTSQSILAREQLFYHATPFLLMFPERLQENVATLH
ncbi:hypothetical protein CRM22_002579 [Opisthorchis felineus]|uniref:Uncharacterized protein n=1 Tax=Opisthorchis felineus TaxID=147828 RepID=A0A4S2MBD6_OPIFE|nr:hypothetical protein CRM22_002578 [Opisthorchis felineus]TGZ71528.1 hypothetical protein CRM22_002579 [Opisthorchis felineus]